MTQREGQCGSVRRIQGHKRRCEQKEPHVCRSHCVRKLLEDFKLECIGCWVRKSLDKLRGKVVAGWRS